MHVLDTLRQRGWTVAVHNDYRQNGRAHTFWLLTHPNGRYVIGEGETDAQALIECHRQIERYSYEAAPASTSIETKGTFVTLGFMDEQQARAFGKWLAKATA